jgi:LDH2 family malate/lactate/ureidoglycolate dehydrogenase
MRELSHRPSLEGIARMAAMGEVLIAADVLRPFSQAVIRRMGAGDDIAEEVGDHLVGANLAGHDSHGVLRLTQYVEAMDRGNLAPGARGAPVKESPSLCLFDAQRGFGQWSGRRALEWCLDAAEGTGIAAASVRHSMHAGRLGHYAEVAAGRGLVGLVCLGLAGPGAGIVAPFGGAGRFLSTNPWAIGVPATGRTPLVVDFATAQLAEGKVRVARFRGKQLPEGVLFDAAGAPSTEPQDLYDGGALTTVGGALTGHKGYGLSLAAAVLGGLAMIDDEAPTPSGAMSGPPPAEPWMAGFFLVVLDPEWFGGAERYAQQVTEVLEAAGQVPAAAGTEQVLVPGEPEAAARAARERDGISLPEPVWTQLRELGDRFQVPMPD